MAEIKEYSAELQKLFIEFLLKNHDLYARCRGILDSEYFDHELRDCVKFIIDHADKYSAVPTKDQVEAKTQVKLGDITSATEQYEGWFLDEFEQFCKHKALELAILKSYDKLENQEYGTVEKLIKDAVQIGLAKDFGIDYWENPAKRLKDIQDNHGQTSTGWITLDKKLFGGFNKGELNIFAGGSGAGKSLFLQNLAINWAKAGLNVLYISLELSEQLTSMRMDAMHTDMSTKELFKNLEDVDLKVRLLGKNAGRLQVVQLPNGCNVNDIRALHKEFQLETDIVINCVLLDYLDLMMPLNRKVSVSDLYTKDKLVSEELRNFALEGNFLFVTASQLNRGAVDEIEFDHSHIAGGLSKIQTADNVIGIFSSRAMRERGRVQIQFMKTRSSSAVGQKLDFGFDINSLRITDLEDDEDDNQTTSSLYEKLKQKNQVSDTVETNTVIEKAVDSQDRLRSLLRKLE